MIELNNVLQSSYISGSVMKTIKPLLVYEYLGRYHKEISHQKTNLLI